MAYGWVFWASLLASVAMLATALFAHPALPSAVTWHQSPVAETVWLPAAVGMVLAWLTTRARQRRDLERRCQDALAGHPVGSELRWLLFFLACFAIGTVGLSLLFGQVVPDAPYVPTVRVVFLFVLPVVFVDQAGFTLTGEGTAMPALAMGVTEPWRWFGLLPTLVTIALVALPLRATPLPSPDLALLGALVAFVAISIPEEIFFRGMLQSRLEQLVGRWSGIVLTSLLFAATYAVTDGRNELAPLTGEGLVTDAVAALLTYGPLGLLYGYVWVCYRNIWLNVLLRGGMLTLVLAPALRLFE
ncbi:CAAX prenyl protease-like protein [Haloactinospora alba]|uniref:CAAX prenyl protease-like protein n=1 Tax=Haloactinospora alba TaxID=405555 RepID=A0A543N7I7_9ACTN|nr:type II CAAX endopeptidase family protein [Haloactinospora alba]TQN27782.1 CAAX prenyl protease-like protein [Haloactinospora alba]